MKHLIILGDGMADEPFEKLGGKTPMELAYKPNMDALAKNAIVGILATIPAKIIIDIPFPIPLSVISSPSHIRNAVPAVNDTVIVI